MILKNNAENMIVDSLAMHSSNGMYNHDWMFSILETITGKHTFLQRNAQFYNYKSHTAKTE